MKQDQLRAEDKRKQTTAGVFVVLAVQLVGGHVTHSLPVCLTVCLHLCRDRTLEGFIGGGFIGNVTLWSPVMFRHLRRKT